MYLLIGTFHLNNYIVILYGDGYGSDVSKSNGFL
jgi:hypothetical protein